MQCESSRAPLPHIPAPFYGWLTATFLAGLLGVVASGCQQSAGDAPPTAPVEETGRTVGVVHPERKTIHREVGQPGLIQAFERTPIVTKIPGYVSKWNVDIGDAVRKGQILAELWIPEVVSELRLKEEQVNRAEKALAMAQAQVATATAQVQEAESARRRAEADNNYWKSQSDRFAKLVTESVLDKQTQDDTINKFQSAAAALAEAQAKVDSAKALLLEKERARDKAEVDVRAADADRRCQADLVAYGTLTAPYDGIVTQRNINTKQFVQPATGVPGDVLYVVERADMVRIFVSVPEIDADWVHVGTPALVRVQALRGQEFKGTVTRTAWSLNTTTRTLLTEIDLHNPDVTKMGRRLRPGMYAYALVQAEWRDGLTLPASAVTTEGDVNVGYQTFCYSVEDGKVKRTQIDIGARNDQLVEILSKRVRVSNSVEPRSEPFTGTEEVVRSDLAGLKDGQAVQISQKP